MSDDKTELFLDALRFRWNDVDLSASDQGKDLAPPPLEKPPLLDARLLDLPAIDDIAVSDISLVSAIRGRKSRRKFSEEALSSDELAFLLYATQGVKTRSAKYCMKTVPSGGARHALETYLFVDRVRGLEPGMYRYLSLEHKLVLLREHSDAMKAELNEALNGQLYGAALYFIWSAVPYRMRWRYPVVTAKLIALDAGHVCQNLYLACEAIRCGSCAIAAYDQTKLDAFLGLDGSSEFALYMAPVGKLKNE